MSLEVAFALGYTGMMMQMRLGFVFAYLETQGAAADSGLLDFVVEVFGLWGASETNEQQMNLVLAAVALPEDYLEQERA